MSQLSKQIEGCAYNPDGPLMAFRIRGMGIVVYPQEIKVHRAEDEASAPQVIKLLQELLKSPDSKLNFMGELK